MLRIRVGSTRARVELVFGFWQNQPGRLWEGRIEKVVADNIVAPLDAHFPGFASIS
jgi:hypothetical protein